MTAFSSTQHTLIQWINNEGVWKLKLFFGRPWRAHQVILVLLQSRHMFPVLIVLLLKSKYRCQTKDKSHQAEHERWAWIKPLLFQRTMKYCMNLFTTWSIHSVPGWKGLAVLLMQPCFIPNGEGSAWRRCRIGLKTPVLLGRCAVAAHF